MGTTRKDLLRELPVRERRVTLAGITTSLLEGGEGPPLILLHGGIQAGGLVWWRAIPRLVSSYRVIVPDLPGLGESESAEGEPALLERWFHDLIASTGDQPPTLVAHSAPGALATRFAARHRDLISRLVLVDSAGLSSSRPPLGLLVAALRSTARPNPRNLGRFMGKITFDLDRLRQDDPEGWAAFSSYVLARARVASVKKTMRSVVRSGLRPIPETELRDMAVPVTMIWGRHDLLIPLQVAETAASSFGWPLHVVDAAGHLPHIEQPDGFVAALTATMEEVPAAVRNR